MKEILIAFIFALIIGSIINGYRGDTATSSPSTSNAASIGSVVPLEQQDFQGEVLDSKIPVLVDFYSPNSTSSQKMDPIISQIADEEKGKIKIMKIDVMANPDIANKYGIAALPTLLLFKNGQKVESMNGEVSHDNLQSLANKYEEKAPDHSSPGGT